MLGFDALASFPLGGVPGSARTDVLTAESGSYAVTGNASFGSYGEAAQSGSYVITGNAAAMALAAQSGSYTLTGSDAAASRAVDTGSYALTGTVALFAATWAVEPGSYTLTLGNFELRRSGYDYPPDQYGIGHIKLAMEEARRLSRVVKATPYPVVRRLPALPVQQSVPVQAAPVQGLIDNSDIVDRLMAAEQAQAAQREAAKRMQVRNRAVTVLLLAA